MLRQQPLIVHILKRFKSQKKVLKIFEKPRKPKAKTSIDRALEHFDDFYHSVFGSSWPGIRASLLTENKFAAVVNNYGDAESVKQELELLGAINVRKLFEIYYDEGEAIKNTKKDISTDVDERLDQFVQQKQKSEVKSIYQNHVEVELEKLALEKYEEPSRQIDAADVVNYKKSLQKSLSEDTEFDLNRMISAEVGEMGLQEFIPATKLKGMDDFVIESEHYQYYNTGVEFPLKFEPELNFQIPKSLDIYTFPKGDISRFPRPKECTTKALSYFLLDGGSILPPLMLNIQPNDEVLDACAAPGGKSLILLQSLLPQMVVCNDISSARINRLYKFFFQYLPNFTEEWENERCIIQREDVRHIQQFGKYDKILVDVPCSNDRQSVMENDNNLFKGNRIKERLHLPEEQASILSHCIQLLKPGGSLVYSTCSLSPIQNDGVVNMALTKAFTEFHITVTIKDLTNVLKPFKKMYFFEEPKNLKFGQLVLPQLPCNFGPMYFCKIKRNEN